MSTNTGSPFNFTLPQDTDLADFVNVFLKPQLTALNTYALHSTATQVLVNKSIADATDNSKTLGFNLAGTAAGLSTTLVASATGTSKTLTLPNLTDTLVGRTTTDTLTNKTLTSPSITSPSITSPTISSGGITVTTGGATISGNSTITGTLGGLTGLTVASGNVGIGTTSPVAGDKLTITGGRFRLNTDAAYNAPIIMSNDTGVSDNLIIKMYSPQGVNSFAPWYIRAGVSGVDGAAFAIQTGTAANIGSETVSTKLFINTAGLVGIGTSSPAEKLHVAGNVLLDNQNGYYVKNTAGTSCRVGAVDAANQLIFGDTNSTSMYLNAGANLYFSANGTNRGNINGTNGYWRIGDSTAAGSTLDVKGTLRLSGSGSGYVGLSPASAAGSTTYTLPAADGSANQVLSTNGSGVLSWMANGSGGGSGATLAATNAWTGVNSFAIKTNMARMTGANFGAGPYPFDYNNTGTVTLQDSLAPGYVANNVDSSSTNFWPTNDNFALVNTYGSKWTGIGFHSGTMSEVQRVSASLSMASNTKWQNTNAMIVGYLNNGPRVLFSDFDLETSQSNTIRLVAEQVVLGSTTGGGIVHVYIPTIADVSTTLDHKYGYVLLGGTTAYTITLPSAAIRIGRWYSFKKITATNVVTITAAAGQTIDGASSVTISAQYAKLTLIACSDTEWFVV